MRNRLRVLILICSLVAILILAGCHPPTPANITVDYSSSTSLNAQTVGMAETGYGDNGLDITNDFAELGTVSALNLGSMRMDLHWSTPGNYTSQIWCGGEGCHHGATGDEWISSIKAAGAIPIVITCRTSCPNPVADAVAMVKHFNWTNGQVDTTKPNYVRYWLFGNEPDINNCNAACYSTAFNPVADAMHNTDPAIKIGGPTNAFFDHNYIQSFLNSSGTRADFIDFHGYPQQGCSACAVKTYAEHFDWAAGTGNDITDTWQMINATVPGRAAGMFVTLGEWSLNWDGDRQMSTNFFTVWTADVVGQVMKHGGRSMYYGTKCNALKCSTGSETDDQGHTVTLQTDDPKPAYRGLGMFTGAGQFRPFGTKLVAASTSLPNVDVFASDNSKNIVVVNKGSAAQDGVFDLSGVTSGTVDVWQKNQNVLFTQPPAHLADETVDHNGEFFATLPPLSVTTFVVN